MHLRKPSHNSTTTHVPENKTYRQTRVLYIASITQQKNKRIMQAPDHAVAKRMAAMYKTGPNLSLFRQMLMEEVGF